MIFILYCDMEIWYVCNLLYTSEVYTDYTVCYSILIWFQCYCDMVCAESNASHWYSYSYTWVWVCLGNTSSIRITRYEDSVWLEYSRHSSSHDLDPANKAIMNFKWDKNSINK